MFVLLIKQDIEDFTIGCCFFGTGGGGNPKFGQKMLYEALDSGKQIRFIETTSIEDEDWIVCPYLMGTSGPETEEQQKGKQTYGLPG